MVLKSCLLRMLRWKSGGRSLLWPTDGPPTSNALRQPVWHTARQLPKLWCGRSPLKISFLQMERWLSLTSSDPSESHGLVRNVAWCLSRRRHLLCMRQGAPLQSASSALCHRWQVPLLLSSFSSAEQTHGTFAIHAFLLRSIASMLSSPS